MPETSPSGGSPPIRVDILCTGLDHIRRGYESFARECFDAFRDDKQVDFRLYKGSGGGGEKESSLPCLSRNTPLARILGVATGRSSYHVEQLSFLLSYLAGPARKDPADVIFTSDANLANFLSRWRRRAGARYGILFSNGGPVLPPFPEYDHVQQVALPFYQEAIAAGEPALKHSLVPYGIHVQEKLRRGHFQEASACRTKLGLPKEKQIVLSVGNISAYHKRMDYVVREVALIPSETRPFLLLVGQQDLSTAEISALANELLGSSGFRMASVPYCEMEDFYGAADAFVLASLKEGFGRVLLEASSHGLPCLVDDNPVMRYVLGAEGRYADLRKGGALAGLVSSVLKRGTDDAAKEQRVAAVQMRFGWSGLKSEYVSMFAKTIKAAPSHSK
jgi:1,2-diacylglycerol 3-alpha-glucosyltransferase